MYFWFFQIGLTEQFDNRRESCNSLNVPKDEDLLMHRPQCATQNLRLNELNNKTKYLTSLLLRFLYLKANAKLYIYTRNLL